MKSLPKFWNYGNYARSNCGVNSLAFEISTLTIYYSYNTPIAFRTPEQFIMRENDWQQTTGKHMNWLDDDKSKRIKGELFEELLAAEVEGLPK